MGRLNPLLTIGVPTWGTVSIEWAMAYRNLGGTLGSTLMQVPVKGKAIAAARNELMQRAIQSGSDYLFMLGDDVISNPDAMIRLLHRLWEHPEIDLVTGVYWTKGYPTAPYLWRGIERGPYLDWTAGEWFRVDFAGCDCLLVRLSPRLKALGPEWFTTRWVWDEEQPAADEALATEDFIFYTRAREAGIELWCDSNVQCIHQDRHSGALFGLTNEMPQAGGPAPSLPAGGTRPDGVVRVAELGAGIVSPFFGHVGQVEVVRFDADEAVRPDCRCDLRHLPVPDESFDVVHSRHVLEHFGRAETVAVLEEWTRILRVGGELRIGVPNLLSAIEQVRRMDAGEIPPDPYPWWQLYGEQASPLDFHRNGFTERRLRLLLEGANGEGPGCFDDVTVEAGDGGLNLYARAVKVRHVRPPALVPAWDRIAEREGLALAGVTPPAAHGSDDVLPVVAVGPETFAPHVTSGPPQPDAAPTSRRRNGHVPSRRMVEVES